MKLITKKIKDKLLKNVQKALDAQSKGLDEPKHFPPLKLFNAFGAGTWLITEMDIDNNDILFGIADLGLGFVDMRSVSLQELKNIKVGNWATIERDMHFNANKTLSEYMQESQKECRIVA